MSTVTNQSNLEKQWYTAPVTTPLQKAFLILGGCTLIALVSLTASLPVPLHPTGRFSSQGDDADNATLVVGDTAWMLVATILGILAAPLLAFIYGSLYGRTSSFSTLAITIVSGMITVVWVLLSFSLIYANGTEILGYPKTYYMFNHVGDQPNLAYAPTIPFNIFAIFELAFALLSASIVISSILDRVNLYGLTAFMLIWHLVVYAPIAHIVWQYNGVLFDNDIQDFSGGMVVHMTAGMTALVAHLFLNWVDAPFPEDTRPIHKEETLLSGVFCYWLANFGLQAGKAYNAGFLASQTIVNVIAATMTSILLNYFLDQVFSVPNSTTSLTNAVLIGIVSSSAAGGFVSVGGVMCISVLCMLVVRLVGKVAFDEGLNNRPYTILSIHGLGGTIAFLFTPFFSHQFLSSRAYKGLIDNSPTAIRYQTAAVVTFWAAGSLAAFVALLFSNLIVPLSKARQSGKGDFAPTPIGPFTGDAKDKQHAGQYKPNASFNIDKN